MMRLYSVALVVAAVLLANVERTAAFELTTADYPSVVSSAVDNQNGIAPTRLLRHNDGDDEERAIGGGATSDLATKLKGVASKFAEAANLQKFVNVKKYETQLARTANIGSDALITLTGPNLERLTTLVQKFNSDNIIKKISVIGTLTAKYGDDALAQGLVSAERHARTDASKTAIQGLRKDQLQRWLDGGNSADDVFKLLKLQDDGHNAIISRKFEVLHDYVTFFNSKNSDKRSLLTTLIKGVGGEDKLGTLLQVAKADPRTVDKARQVETSLITKWSREGKLPADVFQWLKLYSNVDDAFTAENFNRFAKYVDDFNGKDSRNAKSAVEILTNSFGGVSVANKLVSAINDPARKSVAKMLLKNDFALWVKAGITPANFMSSVFKTSASSATNEQKLIASRFKAFYTKTSGLDIPIKLRRS